MNFIQRTLINMALNVGWKPILQYLAKKVKEQTDKTQNKWDDFIGDSLALTLNIFSEIEDVKIDENLQPKLKEALHKVVEKSETQIDNILANYIPHIIIHNQNKDYNKIAILVTQISKEILELNE